MATHTYPLPQTPAPGSLPSCGCAEPEWLDPANALCGCLNCGRAIDPRLVCSGPPTSTHWTTWLAERSRLEALLVAASVAMAEAERLRRIDQRRKDAGNERSIETAIRKQRETVAAGGTWDAKSHLRTRHKIADTASVNEAAACLRAIVASIFTLRAECCMCAAAWDRKQESWRTVALVDPELVRLTNLSDAAQEALERGHNLATYKAHIEAEAARQIGLVLAVERARLAETMTSRFK